MTKAKGINMAKTRDYIGDLMHRIRIECDTYTSRVGLSEQHAMEVCTEALDAIKEGYELRLQELIRAGDDECEN